ncbi:unnamed protein product [Gadus morhua 'NCC']
MESVSVVHGAPGDIFEEGKTSESFCRRRGNKLSQSRLSSWGHRCLETPGRSQGLKAGRDIQGLGVESASHNSHKQKDPGETGAGCLNSPHHKPPLLNTNRWQDKT